MQPPTLPESSPADSAGSKTSQPLDQWRGLALVFVLISHGFYFTGRVHGIGRIGVDLFFFISGILVFRSLDRASAGGEGERSRSFLKRRFIRLFPALAAYLLAMFAVVGLTQGLHNLPPGSDVGTYLRAVPSALLYLVDFAPGVPLSLGHLWSISVEMQFYVLAPLLYFLGKHAGRGRLALWTIILVILMFFGVEQVFRGYQEKYQFQSAVWPMMLGFVMEYGKGWATLVPPRWAIGAIALGLMFLVLAMILPLLGLPKSESILAGSTVFVPCFLCYVGNRSLPGATGRALGWLGERTYSIYLWQQPLTLCGFFSLNYHALGAALSVGVGAVWYHFWERPFLSANRR